jgi:hypothetical protein
VKRADPSRPWSAAGTPWIVRPGYEAWLSNPRKPLPVAGLRAGPVPPSKVPDYFRGEQVEARRAPSKTTKGTHYWTGEPIEAAHVATHAANGYVIYRGPSRIDGAPIVAIATGFRDPTANRKTGPMIQTWILREDVPPLEAVATGADRSICGECPHRGGFGYAKKRGRKGTRRVRSEVVPGVEWSEGGREGGRAELAPTAKGRSCYVVVSQAPTSVWKSYHLGKYPFVPVDKLPDLFSGTHPLRIGSYGEPVAVPENVWRSALARQFVWTGYTHGWDRPENQGYRDFLMASVDSIEEQRRAAQVLGWRTFRIGSKGEPPQLVAGVEVVCPATPEGGRRRKGPGGKVVVETTSCDACGLCMGTTKKARSIVVAPHGSGARFHEERAAGQWHGETYFPPGYAQNPREPVSHLSARWLMGRWHVVAYRAGRQVATSRDRFFPVDVSQFGPTRGTALAHALRDAFPSAEVHFPSDAQAALRNPPTCRECRGVELRQATGGSWSCPKCLRWYPTEPLPEGAATTCYDCQRAAPVRLGLCSRCARERAMRKPKAAKKRSSRMSSDERRRAKQAWKVGARVRERGGTGGSSVATMRPDGSVELSPATGTITAFRVKGSQAQVQVAWDQQASMEPGASTRWINAHWNLELLPPTAGPLFDQDHAPRPNPGHPHPRIKLPVSRMQVEGELAHLHREAGLRGVPQVSWPADLTRLHEQKPRRYAQVFTGVGPGQQEPRYELAEQTRWLPEPQRLGVLAHEVGHVLDPTGGEDGADAAAERAFGVPITYDQRWVGKGLQTVRW